MNDASSGGLDSRVVFALAALALGLVVWLSWKLFADRRGARPYWERRRKRSRFWGNE